MNRFAAKLCVFTALSLWGATCSAGTYQNLVKSMDPTYYYELNEEDTSSGAVDSMGRGPAGTYNGDYDVGPEVGIPGPDFLFEGGAWTITEEWDDIGDEIDLVGLGDDNVAHASNNAGHITLGDGADFAANAMSVAMFARGGGNAQGGDRLFTNNVTDPLTSFQIVVGNDGLVVSTNPTVECESEELCGHRSLFFPDEGFEFTNQGADRGLISDANGWWHIVAATEGTTALERTENIRLWLNGVDRTDDMLPGTTGWGTDTGLAKIGGRRADPTDSTTHSGAQDEVSIWLNRVLSDEEALALYEAAITESVSLPGDYNEDELVDVQDIDLQSVAMKDPTPARIETFDENGDGMIDYDDRVIWVKQHRKTWVGDANLDNEFNSGDLVVVFAAGTYETETMAGWAEGDWNGDMRFDSSDLVVAFADGGYELGPPAPAVAAVPEPTSFVLALVGVLGLLGVARRRKE